MGSWASSIKKSYNNASAAFETRKKNFINRSLKSFENKHGSIKNATSGNKNPAKNPNNNPAKNPTNNSTKNPSNKNGGGKKRKSKIKTKI